MHLFFTVLLEALGVFQAFSFVRAVSDENHVAAAVIFMLLLWQARMATSRKSNLK